MDQYFFIEPHGRIEIQKGTLSLALIEWRKKYSLTQEQALQIVCGYLSKILDIKTYRRWEHNETLPHYRTYEAILRILMNEYHISIFALFGTTELGGHLCYNFVLKGIEDHMLDSTWHSFFQAHIRKVQR